MIEDQYAGALEDILDFTKMVATFGSDPFLVQRAIDLHREWSGHDPYQGIEDCAGCAEVKANSR